MPNSPNSTNTQIKSTVKRNDASPEDVAAYFDVTFTTLSGINDAICILKVRKIKPETTADELRIIEFELGDQIAKKARILSQIDAFIANHRAMMPPSEDMITSAKDLLKQLDSMIAANNIASQVVKVSTELFKIWQQTERDS